MRTKRALYGKQCVPRIFLTNFIFSNLHILMDICLFSAHCKHVPCNTLTDSTNEDLLNIKRKDDTKSLILSRTSDTTDTRNPIVIKVILLACFTYIAIFKFYQISSDILTRFFFLRGSCPLRSRNEREFDWMRLDSTLYLGPKNLGRKISHLFWYTGWAWNWQIIFRFASIHGRVCFILSTVKYNSIILFSVLCCPITCLKVPSSLLWCLLRFPNKNDVLFFFSS
jgi:hypothetical protein